MVSTKNFKYKKWAENQPTPTLDKEPIKSGLKNQPTPNI